MLPMSIMRARAVTLGQIADVLQARGQLDEALRIRQEEELPVYERLGDVQARALWYIGQIDAETRRKVEAKMGEKPAGPPAPVGFKEPSRSVSDALLGG